MDYANAANIKRLNRSRVFRLISACDKISKQDIASELSISLPTVTQNLNELKEMGLIADTGSFVSTVGRRARAISLVSDAYVGVGLDITSNHIALVMLDLKNNIIKSIRKRMQPSNTIEYCQQLANEVNTFIADCGIEHQKVLGVGITIPGIVVENGTKIELADTVNIDRNFYFMFKDYIDIPCILLNDANASGFAEFHFSKPVTDLVYVFLSNTVGGAILLNSSMHYGTNMRAGEFGHMTLIPNGMRCHCGHLGCADPYLCSGFLAHHCDDNLSLFFDHLKKGVPEIVEAFNIYLQNLAILVTNIRMCLDCEIVIGGYVGSYMEDYLDELRRLVKERLTFGRENADFVKCCTLKLEASAVGGALHYVDKFIQSI